MRANERERKLAREQFVVGEPRPGLALRQDVGGLVGMMQGVQRVGEGGKALALQPGGVLPFRQLRDFREGGFRSLSHRVERQPFGERIDRLDHRQLVELGLAHHAVGMHHLQHAVIERGHARHVAHLAGRKELFEIVALGVEIGERQCAGVVVGFDAIGQPRAVRRRRPVAVDGHRDGRDGAWHHVAEYRPRPAVDGAGRQMEQQVDHARRRILAAEQLAVELFELRPDARKRGQRGEQRIEQRGAHGTTLHGFLTGFNMCN